MTSEYKHIKFGEIVNAYQVNIEDMDRHWKDPTWYHWPKFIQQVMRSDYEYYERFFMRDVMTGARELNIYGNCQVTKAVRNGDWILQNKHGDLFLYPEPNFLYEFERVRKIS